MSLVFALVRWIIGAFLAVTASMALVSPIFWEPGSDRRLDVRAAFATAILIALAAVVIPRPRRVGRRLLLGAAATVVHLTIWYARWG